ncbi:unnamed protein product [Rotaria sp. Silwood1]|nr:unnamed protein product [Rotaria sp. Silwood1]CAF3845478.1 unnamed protein product [Rotaria sp. Silwood1]CAF4820887.1 unnamed protein product [Rotaria sp. Silwood1]
MDPNAVGLFLLSFYANSHHFIQDVIIAGIATFNQGRNFWSAMLMLLTGRIMGSIHTRPTVILSVFLTPYAPNEESYSVTTTEQTSLLQSADDDDNSLIDSMRDHQIGNFERASVSDYTHSISKPSGSTDSENVSILSRQTTVNGITTTDLVFDQPQTNSQRYPYSQIPHIVLRQSSSEEKDNNITTSTSYGSFHDSPSGSFTTPHAANFLDGSLDGTSDDTNIAARSVIEGVSDMKTDDNGEPINSALPDGSKQANIPNGTTTD